MKLATLIQACLICAAFSHSALAQAPDNHQAVTLPAQTGAAPQMSEIPKMQEQGKRMAELMEKIKEVTDPAERKRILAEATCPQ